MRKIAVVTGSRAEYGLLYWIIKEINEDHELALQLIVTGMHLAPEFGLTVRTIEKDGFPVADQVEMLLSADSEEAVAASMGLGMIGFAKVYRRLQPDLILILGDRFEIFAAAAAAVPLRIPVAHIHGGEATEGAMDEYFRHAITKMSLLHFAAAPRYRQRIIQMGESPDRVFCFGAPGLDNIMRLPLLDASALRKELGLVVSQAIGVVTYHPVTHAGMLPSEQIAEVLAAVSGFKDIYWIFTLPNADPGGRELGRLVEDYLQSHPDMGKLYDSLGQLHYLSLLKHSLVMVGNSSSGIIEAPSFRLPVVNVGNRQEGRIKAANVIDVPRCRREDIAEGIRRAKTELFVRSLDSLENPYGNGEASGKIVASVKTFPINEQTLKKRFYELADGNQ